jgi:hypothetical protein
LSQGSFNEWFAPNPLAGHLKDYWNNYNGVLIGKSLVASGNASITNDGLAKVVTDQVNESLSGPIGTGPVVIFRGGDHGGSHRF